jgi:GT2 family glycosyltransferase
MEHPMLSIVTVCHNSSKHLGAFVESFLATSTSVDANQKVEFIFVDNSDDQSLPELLAPLRDKGYAVTLKYTENRGFGAGCNVGAAYASRETLLFVNPDVTFLTDISLFALSDTASWGTCRQQTKSGRSYSFDLLPEFKGYLYEMLRLYRFSDWMPKLGLNRRLYVVGSFMAVRHAAFAAVGGFDERFFLYYEEAELARRLQERFGTPDFVQTTEVFHEGFGSQEVRDFTLRAEAESYILYASLVGKPWIVRKRRHILWLKSFFAAGEERRLEFLRRASSS